MDPYFLSTVLLPTFICVVLPVMVVWLVLRSRKNTIDKQTEIAIKAIENGTPIDPEFLLRKGRRA